MQSPFTHDAPAPHTRPHSPQLLLSFRIVTHPLAHIARPVPHGLTQ
jgi:hypothetical protein